MEQGWGQAFVAGRTEHTSSSCLVRKGVLFLG